jgi:hypothetical protein
MPSQSKRMEIKFDEIPVKLMEGVHNYAIILFGYQNPTTMAIPSGTGTLVKVGDAHYILTAQHCAERLFEYEQICMPYRPGCPPLVIRMMEPIYIGERKNDEWGPDLAFLPIHPIDVKNINAVSHKFFYNLSKYESDILREGPKIRNSIWAVVGSPALLNKVNPPLNMELQLMAYKVGVESPITKEDFDYIEIRVALDRKNALPSFQGLSGGGLWQAEIKRLSDNSLTLVGSHRLVGCAFYQTEAQGQYRYIRCHGWRSIYEQGLSRLRR